MEAHSPKSSWKHNSTKETKQAMGHEEQTETILVKNLKITAYLYETSQGQKKL